MYEIPLGYLAGQVVTIATSLFDASLPVPELDQKRIPLRVVDPVGNGTRPRPPRRPAPDRPATPVEFDPRRTLDAADEEDADDELF